MRASIGSGRAWGTVAVLATLACGGSTEAAAPATQAAPAGATPAAAPPSTPARKPVDPATTGSIRGVVRYGGPPPARETIPMIGEAFCLSAHPGGGVLDQRLLVRDGRLQNAFVWIRSGLEGWSFPRPEQPVVFDQHGCLYEPRVLGVQVGQMLRVTSDDPVLHNVHLKPEVNRPRNIAMPRDGPPVEFEFKKPEVMVEVICDIHAWMKGWIGVVPHPCFAVTGEDGSFRIDGVPPGDYVLQVWHETLGTREVDLTVGEKQDLVLDDVVFTP